MVRARVDFRFDRLELKINPTGIKIVEKKSKGVKIPDRGTVYTFENIFKMGTRRGRP